MERWRLSFTSRNRRSALLNAKSAQAECLCYPEGRGEPAPPFSRNARKEGHHREIRSGCGRPRVADVAVRRPPSLGTPRLIYFFLRFCGSRVSIFSNGFAYVPLAALIACSNVEDSGQRWRGVARCRRLRRCLEDFVQRGVDGICAQRDRRFEEGAPCPVFA